MRKKGRFFLAPLDCPRSTSSGDPNLGFMGFMVGPVALWTPARPPYDP